MPEYVKYNILIGFFWTYRERELNPSIPVKRRIPLRRLKVSPRLPVPDHIPKPPYVSSKLLPEISSEFQIHDEEGIARMRAACELAAKVLEHAGTLVRVRTLTTFMYFIVFRYLVSLKFACKKYVWSCKCD